MIKLKPDPDAIKVIYRTNRKNGLVKTFALFPEIYWAVHPASGKRFCGSYDRIGQHCGADYEQCIRDSRPASMDDPEVKALHDELVNSGYKLQVAKRIRRDQMFTKKA